jgi:hypothetical protein
MMAERRRSSGDEEGRSDEDDDDDKKDNDSHDFAEGDFLTLDEVFVFSFYAFCLFFISLF